VAQADEGVTSLSKLIENLKREMGDEDLTFMQVTRLSWMMRFSSSDLLLCVGNLQICCCMLEIAPFVVHLTDLIIDSFFFVFQKFHSLKER